VPTWRGWLLLIVLCAALLGIIVRTIHPLLAVNDPAPGEVLVVEGWAPDYAFKAAITEFQKHPYKKLYVTGGPLEAGGPLFNYRTYAERGAAVLLGLGLHPASVQAVPAAQVYRDRTFVSALALRRYLQAHQGLPKAMNVVTVGCHARRTRFLFEKALGQGTRVGVLSIPSAEYEADHWWAYSAGVRLVLGETFAFCYGKVFFSPKNESGENP
jgi:hypothetical protein